MALYDYTCECGFTEEYLVPYQERDTKEIECPECGKVMKREMPMAQLHGDKYHMQAITHAGEHVKGHFGGDGLPERWKGK